MTISKKDLKKQKERFGEDLSEIPNSSSSTNSINYNIIDNVSFETRTAIVVGGSPNILKYNYGKKIDSFDKVIRLNSCVTDGVEDHVGSKTNIWVTSGTKQKWLTRWGGYFFPDEITDSEIWFRTEHTLMDYGLLSEKWYNRKFRFRVLRYKRKSVLTNKSINEDNFGGLLLHDEGKWTWSGTYLTTGMMAILGALKFYPKVVIAGFTFYTEGDNIEISSVYSGVSLRENLEKHKHAHKKILNGFVQSGRLEFLIPEEKYIFDII